MDDEVLQIWQGCGAGRYVLDSPHWGSGRAYKAVFIHRKSKSGIRLHSQLLEES